MQKPCNNDHSQGPVISSCHSGLPRTILFSVIAFLVSIVHLFSLCMDLNDEPYSKFV